MRFQARTTHGARLGKLPQHSTLLRQSGNSGSLLDSWMAKLRKPACRLSGGRQLSEPPVRLARLRLAEAWKAVLSPLRH